MRGGYDILEGRRGARDQILSYFLLRPGPVEVRWKSQGSSPFYLFYFTGCQLMSIDLM